VAPTVLRGTHAKYLFGGTLEITNRTPPQSDTELLGLEGKVVPAHEPFLDVSYDHNGAVTTTIRIPDYFPPGSILMFETQVQYADDDLEDFITYGADRAVAKLDILDLNVALYRSDREEEDTTPGHSVYNVPGVGRLPYAGIEGFMWLLRDIIARNDLAHPFCNHLREGFWSFDYLYDRLTRYLDKYPNLEALRNWYAERVKRIKRVANFLAPKLFALLVHTAYHAMIERILDQMPPRLRNSSSFARSLALCSVQLYGYVPSTGLSTDSLLASLAAGLPHFATHHMRCWGRDTFISLRGIFLLTGNMDAARSHILAFASSIRHGLIPNLLDGLRYPRYNARDATWWFLQAVKSYCEIVENGTEILDEKVARRFPKDDRFVDEKDPEAFATVSTLAEIIQEICQRHANGIHFREWTAGPKLDHAMQDPGFQVDIQLDPATGFISGGNSWNCGTWMDKMGDSEKAGNFGKPTTPRDGAAVEIIGLVKSTVTWLHKMYTRKKFPYAGVELKDGKSWCVVKIQNPLINVLLLLYRTRQHIRVYL
jgi:glycogen debranching enzyme